MGFNNFMKAIQGVLGVTDARKVANMPSEVAKGIDCVSVMAQATLHEVMKWKAQWTVIKYRNEKDFRMGRIQEVIEVPGNLLLNEGITEMLKLLIGDGAAVAYNNANARLGVGNSNVAAAATQTDLQGASKTYKGMDANYPQVSNQTVTFRATFGADDANYAWIEFVVDNGAVGLKTLNRKVQTLGVKESPAVWTLSLDVTIS